MPPQRQAVASETPESLPPRHPVDYWGVLIGKFMAMVTRGASAT